MNRIFIHGLGAVSPAGWSVGALREAVARGEPLPRQQVQRDGWRRPLQFRSVPAPITKPPWLAHPRLRRASPLSHYVTSAALEALGAEPEAVAGGERKLGVIVCVMSGPVNYSRRFYDETLKNPATASPLVFPETVFNAPASHLAAVLGTTATSYTLVGDPGTFLQALALGADWLRSGHVERCLIVGAEESDWITARGAALFAPEAIVSAGAGAVLLGGNSGAAALVELECVTDAVTFSGTSREEANRRVRAQLGPGALTELLCDSQTGVPRLDAPGQAAWCDWPGARVSPMLILGEGFAAGSAWQCVAALDSLARGEHPAATVSVAGINEQAIAARFLAAPAL